MFKIVEFKIIFIIGFIFFVSSLNTEARVSLSHSHSMEEFKIKMNLNQLISEDKAKAVNYCLALIKSDKWYIRLLGINTLKEIDERGSSIDLLDSTAKEDSYKDEMGNYMLRKESKLTAIYIRCRIMNVKDREKYLKEIIEKGDDPVLLEAAVEQAGKYNIINLVPEIRKYLSKGYIKYTAIAVLANFGDKSLLDYLEKEVEISKKQKSRDIKYLLILIKKIQIINSKEEIQVKELIKVLDEQNYDRSKYNYEEIMKDKTGKKYDEIELKRHDIDYVFIGWTIEKLGEKNKKIVIDRLKQEYIKDTLLPNDEIIRDIIRQKLVKLIKKDELLKLDKYINERMNKNHWIGKRIEDENTCNKKMMGWQEFEKVILDAAKRDLELQNFLKQHPNADLNKDGILTYEEKDEYLKSKKDK